MTANGHETSFWGDDNIPEFDSSDGYTNLVNILKTTGHFKRVNFV